VNVSSDIKYGKLLFLSKIQYFMYVQLPTIISIEFIYYYDLWNIFI